MPICSGTVPDSEPESDYRGVLLLIKRFSGRRVGVPILRALGQGALWARKTIHQQQPPRPECTQSHQRGTPHTLDSKSTCHRALPASKEHHIPTPGQATLWAPGSTRKDITSYPKRSKSQPCGTGHSLDAQNQPPAATPSPRVHPIPPTRDTTHPRQQKHLPQGPPRIQRAPHPHATVHRPQPGLHQQR